MKKQLFFSLLILMVCVQASQAQFWKYTDLSEIEGVQFKYKWVNENRFDKESPLALSIKIKNTNDYKANIKFGIEYYWQATRAGFSEVREFCLLPAEMMVGRISNLVYQIEGYTKEQIESEDFTWNLFEVEIKKVSDCGSLFIKEKTKEEEKEESNEE